MAADSKSAKIPSDLIKKDELEAARKDLYKINVDNPSFAEGQKVLGDIQQREREGKDVAAKLIAKVLADDAKGRQAFARDFEHKALMAGYSVTVSTSGAKATTLNLKYPALSKAAIYQLINDGSLKERLANQGFTRLIVQDGLNWTGNVELPAPTISMK